MIFTRGNILTTSQMSQFVAIKGYHQTLQHHNINYHIINPLYIAICPKHSGHLANVCRTHLEHKHILDKTGGLSGKLLGFCFLILNLFSFFYEIHPSQAESLSSFAIRCHFDRENFLSWRSGSLIRQMLNCCRGWHSGIWRWHRWRMELLNPENKSFSCNCSCSGCSGRSSCWLFVVDEVRWNFLQMSDENKTRTKLSRQFCQPGERN